MMVLAGQFASFGPLRGLRYGLARAFATTAPLASSSKVNLFGLNFDRRIKRDYKESLKYMDSEAFKKTYMGRLVWKVYKRNHKAEFPSKNTRQNCITSDGFLSTSYPCPICRDEYLVLHPENPKLLEQFIDPHTGKIATPIDHGLCQKQYRNLIISVIVAKDIGTLTYAVPERFYDYRDYYENDQK